MGTAVQLDENVYRRARQLRTLISMTSSAVAALQTVNSTAQIYICLAGF